MVNNTPIPISAKRLSFFTPPAIADTDRATRLGIRIPTPSEKDMLGARLFEFGLVEVSEETLRATQISELFAIDWSQHMHLVPPAERSKLAEIDKGSSFGVAQIDDGQLSHWNEGVADMLAQKLDAFWIQFEAESRTVAEWVERERERMLDEAGGAPARPATPFPESGISARDRAAVRLISDLQARISPAYQELLTKRLTHNARQNQMLFRSHVVSTDQPIELHSSDGVMNEDSFTELREFIGERAYLETIQHIDRFYGLPETERKNSDLPPANSSDPTGSPSPSGESASNDGSSTGSNTGPAPVDEFAAITASLSGSQSDNEALMTAAIDIPTEEAG